MGSYINLGIGRLELDWGKNWGFTDHSSLFQQSDLGTVPYYYSDNLIREKPGLAKPLADVAKRLRLLGFTTKTARLNFVAACKADKVSTKKFPFAALASALATIKVESLSPNYGEGDDVSKFFRREIFPRLGLDTILSNPDYVQFHAGLAMENLSAYTIITLLALNPDNAKKLVEWRFDDLEAGGYAERSDFVRALNQNERFLVVTEGTSDARILRHALHLLRPEIADFFYFIDMQEGYPFSGTGSLYKFTQGLVSIGMSGKTIVLFDNDAEGHWNYARTSALPLPINMAVTKLPDLPALRRIQTLGPQGTKKANINKRAAAIECYLDLGPNPVVRWKNYLSDADLYQGEVLGKNRIMNNFLDLGSRRTSYDFTKIEKVLGQLISTAEKIAENVSLRSDYR